MCKLVFVLLAQYDGIALTLFMYAQSCAVLACQAYLSKEERLFYTEELHRLKDDKENPGESTVCNIYEYIGLVNSLVEVWENAKSWF